MRASQGSTVASWAAWSRSRCALIHTIVAALASCNDGAVDMGGSDIVNNADVASSDVAPVASTPIRYPDPTWTEPPPPPSGETLAAITAARSRAAALLGDSVASLETTLESTGAPVLAATLLAERRFDAATWVLSEAAPVAARVTLAGILAMDVTTLEEAATIARSALAELSGETLLDRRLRAAAWSNLGMALRDQPAGSVYAYRQALDLMPGDSAYTLGLAVALSRADLPLPALLMAERAVALEALVRPEATNTPAQRWRAELAERVSTGLQLPPGSTLQKADGIFPAVGATWLGLTVLSTSPDGGVTMSAPPFEPEGVDAAAALQCRGVDGTRVEFDCPDGGWSGEAIRFWYGPSVDYVPMTVPAGTTCDTAIQAALEPPAAPLIVRADVGMPGRELPVGLNLALTERLSQVAHTYGLTTRAQELGGCAAKSSHSQRFGTLDDEARADCGPCLCSNDPDCADCFKRVRSACDELYLLGTALGAAEEARARSADPGLQQSLEAYFAMFPALAAAATGSAVCDADCGDELASDPRLAWAGTLGGRIPSTLNAIQAFPAAAYRACLSRIPPYCPERGGEDLHDVDPDSARCLCLGVGPLEYCLAEDGTVTVKVTALAAVGVQANLNADGPSVRLGFGVGAGVNVGPAKLGASAMTWWDASTNAWVKSDVSLDYGVDTPGGGGVSGAFTCEAWKSGQELLDADMASFFAEATPAPP